MIEYGVADRVKVAFTINGESLSGHAPPRLLLSDFIRQELGLTGTHVGCEHGVCGACTIQLDGRPVLSCLMLAVQAEGRDVRTVEGLSNADGTLNRLQRAFRRHHALQCGFCTSGILISMTTLLAENSAPSDTAIKDVLSGHLCRCTGYVGILRAVRSLGSEMAPEEREERS